MLSIFSGCTSERLVRIVTVPDGADLDLDRVPIGRSPLTRLVYFEVSPFESGQVTVLAKKVGYAYASTLMSRDGSGAKRIDPGSGPGASLDEYSLVLKLAPPEAWNDPAAVRPVQPTPVPIADSGATPRAETPSSRDARPSACRACGAKLEPGERFCATCGARVVSPAPQPVSAAIPAGAFCSSCGAKLDAGAKFCPSCGKAP